MGKARRASSGGRLPKTAMTKHLSESTFESSRRLDLLAEFESLVGAVIRLRGCGSAGTDIARAQGAADGFARAITTLGLVSDADLLEAAQKARRGGTGPATRSIDLSDSGAELIVPSRPPVRVAAVRAVAS